MEWVADWMCVVPGFWLKVFLSSSTVGSTVSNYDEEILKWDLSDVCT